MKDNARVNNEMINGNWVLKRKRGKLPHSPDTSNSVKTNALPSESTENASSKVELKTEISSRRFSSKKKGNDGYFYECVICDLGGNLLCCDSCPRTYHLQCLDPPLKRIPDGKWQCPTCARSDAHVLKNNSDSISKRARTKITRGQSGNEIKSVSTGKVSSILGSSNLKKKRSGKEKSSLSLRVQSSGEELDTVNVVRNKPSLLSCDGSAEVSSLIAKVDNENLPVLSPTPTPEQNSVSGAEGSQPSDVNPERNEGTCEKKSGLSNNVGSPTEVPVLDAASRKARKRKYKFFVGSIQKKPKSGKSDCVVNNSKKRKSEENSSSPQTSKPHRKRESKENSSSPQTSRPVRKCERKKSSASPRTSIPRRKHRKVLHGDSPSVLKTDIDTQIDIPLKDEMVSEEPGHNQLHSAGKLVVETLSREDVPTDSRQVDKVLGCRVRVNESNTSHCITVVDSDDLPAKKSVSSDNLCRISEKNTTCGTTSDDGATENSSQAEQEDTLDKYDEESNVKKGLGADKIANVYRRSMIREFREGDCVDALTSDIKVSDSNALDSKNEASFTAKTEDLARTAGKNLMGETTNLSSSHDNIEVPKAFEMSVSHEAADAHKADVETATSSIPEKIMKDSIMSEAASSSGATVAYEFLVKWVGKSHLHNSWISESVLKNLSKRKLDNYKAKYGRSLIDTSDERWKRPQRVIALRSSTEGLNEVLVKWCSVQYDGCTWERLEEPVIAESSHLVDLFDQFERRAVERDATKEDTPRGKGALQQGEVLPLTEQPKELVGGALFPHQLEALNWLRKCWCRSRNVILADEMGLGKTVSAAAFLSSLYFEFKARHPCLVLVPLSTMPNWMAEFTLWAPDLNVVEYHGSAKARAVIRQYEWHASDRSGSGKKTASYKFNVLLTTYEMVMADSSHLRGVPWEVLIVDEGHRLKNSSSKLFSLLNTFSFQHRVLLTGTPLQNNIGEMYNLLNFLQPASFPSLSAFEEKFNVLTTAEKVDELKKLVAPHMLRRLKKDAMQNIPPKTERMVPVELSSIQAEYYRAMLTKNYQILRNIGKGVAQQSMLNIVMQLRKVCNHPYLIQGTEPESGSVEFLHEMRIKASAKLTLLHSMLKVLHKEGHRVLIFSQMTKLLDILEDYLNIEFGPGTFERVDGSVSVSDRQTAITRFNQDRSRFVFLLSTRSCGLGINLATADTVIIYDSDFNPHADIQAMNRAHRIGQSNRLLVYRLVVRASVEERILQLAKRKLMLDQLFVNKSGSQKEVEDILRWGTEELFNDSSSISSKDASENQVNKDEAGADVEPSRRRRTGGLGDVYKDKCTDGSSKIVWDDNAIQKLLDRSNIQSSLPDNADGDGENDMLGSVKSLEWNDEPAEEHEGSELLPVVNDDTCEQQSEKKEDNAVTVIEENEWDRLLRVRWEKYQNEEEATLGRGKRLRKAVSYREAYATLPTEAPSEGGADEEREPEREYTPAGRALKTKFAKLRARQKERLAQRNAISVSSPVAGSAGIESCLLPSSCALDIHEMAKLNQRSSEELSVIDNKICQNLEVPKTKPDFDPRRSKLKHKMRSRLDYPVKGGDHSSDIVPPGHHLQGTSYTNSVSNNNLLPVLGLCAPNANQMEMSERNISKSHSKQSRQGSRTGFPFDIGPSREARTETDCKTRDNATEKLKLQPESVESLQRGRKMSKHDAYLQHSRPFPLGKAPNHLETCGPSFSEFQEKLALPKLPFDQKLLPNFPFPATNVPHPHPDLFPNLTLGSRTGNINASVQDLPAMPFLPNMKLPHEDMSRYDRQGLEANPMLGLGQIPQTYSSFPENHRKVLENIMMRTGTGPSNFLNRKPIKDIWSEDELDFLWVGVRRHGRGNWDAMLRDPRLKFSKFKTAEDLFTRWEEEQLKILDMPAPPLQKPSKSSRTAKSPLFPGISDAMMTRALHGSRYAGPANFQSHLTDMKLGFTNQPSSLPHFDPSEQQGFPNEHFAPHRTWNADNLHTGFGGVPSARPGTSNIRNEQPFLLDMLGASSLGSLGLNSSSSFALQRQEDESRVSRGWKLPSFLDKSLSILRESNNKGSDESKIPSSLTDPAKGHIMLQSKLKDIVGSSSKNELPHWLREAVGGPTKPDTGLPPSVEAINQSVRILYGDANPVIPPFPVPGPLPAEPKDPRRKLKKKKRQREQTQTYEQFSKDIAGTSHSFQSSLQSENVGSTSLLPVTSGLPSMEPNLNIPPPSVNVLDPSSADADLHTQKKSRREVTPSSEVLQLVASSVAPVPAEGSSRRLPENNLQLPNSVDEVMVPVVEGPCAEQKGDERLFTGTLSSYTKEKAKQTQSGDSSKTHSDPLQPKVGEASSEGTVSDHDHGTAQEA